MEEKKINFRRIINRLILFIGLGVGVHITFVLCTTEQESLAYLQRLTWGRILMILGLLMCPWIGYAARITMWSKFLGEKITFLQSVQVVVTAEVASALSPTAVGGAPVKAGLLLNKGYSTANVGFMLSLGIIEDIIFYTIGIICASWFSEGLVTNVLMSFNTFVHSHYPIIILVCSIILIYILLLKFRLLPTFLSINQFLPVKLRFYLSNLKIKIKDSIAELGGKFSYVLKNGKLQLLISITVLFLQWFAKFTVLIAILSAFEIDFEVIQVYVRQWFVYITMLFIPTPGASGGAEASFLLIFGKALPDDLAFLIVSIWRIFTYYMVLLLSVFLYTTISFLYTEKYKAVTKETD